MTRPGLALFSLPLFFLLLLLPFQPTLAAEQPCDEAGLNAAIAAGGSQTFACSGPTTITITGTKTLTSDLTLDGGGKLTISGSDVYRVFTVNSGVMATLKNLTITQGRAIGHGGGILNQGTLTLDTVTVNHSHASDGCGGGIHNANAATLTITNSWIDQNTATGNTSLGPPYVCRGRGGGIYNGDSSHLSISLSTISQNTATGTATADGGGGIYSYISFPVTLNGSNISLNTAPRGAGIYNYGSTFTITGGQINNNNATGMTGNDGGGGILNHAEMLIDGVLISDNEASRGAAIFMDEDSFMDEVIYLTSIKNSTLARNHATWDGGAVYLINGGLNVLGSFFDDNRGINGGALGVGTGFDAVNIANSTFYYNRATNGGTLYIQANHNPAQRVNLTAVTIYGETATNAGSAFYVNGASVILRNSIITATSGAACYTTGIAITSENNLVDDSSCEAVGTITRLDTVPGNHGGPTQTMALRHRTTAYNAGISCTYRSDGINPLFNHGDPMNIDQRNLARLGACDIGAFEYYGPVITTEPQGQIIVSGQTAVLSTFATGPGTLMYQWYQGSAPDISTPVGTNSTSYTTPPITQDTTYWVRVTNEYDHADSLDAVLTLNVPPQITEHPANQSVAPGGKVTLQVVATGTPNLSYQWYAGDSGDTSHPITGATGVTYTTPSLFSEHHYWVRVSNLEITNSETAVISLTSPLTAAPGRNHFTTQPVPLTWAQIPDAVGYELEVARDAAFANKVYTNLTLGADEWTDEVPMTESGVYYWRVRAKKAPTGMSAWSVVESFVLDLP